MSRLIVVSNRVASPKEGKTAAGGLAVAIQGALRASGSATDAVALQPFVEPGLCVAELGPRTDA